MKRTRLISVLALLALLVCATSAMAGTGSYDLSWNAISSGGQTFSTGSDYSLGGTTGQPGAGIMSGGDFTLSGGFWSGDWMTHNYLPVFSGTN